MAQGLEAAAPGRYPMARDDHFISDTGPDEVTLFAALFHGHEVGAAPELRCLRATRPAWLKIASSFGPDRIDTPGKECGSTVEHARLLVGPLHRRSCSPATSMSAIETSTLAAYEHWAPILSPVAHNPLMRAEQHAMHCRCGRTWRAGEVLWTWPAAAAATPTCYARRMPPQVVALDFCSAMLEASAAGADRVRASMMQLPFQVGSVRRGGLRPGGGSCDGSSSVDVRGRPSALRPDGYLECIPISIRKRFGWE